MKIDKLKSLLGFEIKEIDKKIYTWQDVARLRFDKEYKDIKLKPIVISICQNKGGVGKTTSVINIATMLSYISKVLIIDNDAQANLSQSFGAYPSKNNPSLARLLDNKSSLKDTIINISDSLDLIPNNLYFEEWQEENNDIDILRKFVENIKHDYDFIIIDTPPTLSKSFKMAIYASDAYIIPFEAQPFSLEGIPNIFSKIYDFSNVNDLFFLGLFITKFERGTLSDEILLSIQNEQKFKSFGTKIRKSVSLQQAQSLKESVFDFDENSNACDDYYHLTFEMLERLLK